MTANADAFLDTISACEGTTGPDGYRALFGYTPGNNHIFDNGYIRHPNIRQQFVQTDGAVNYSTAAGRYQIIFPTYQRLVSKLHLTGMFAPADQDVMALELVSECGAMPDVKEGRFQDALDKCAGIWASLPASHYAQPKRTVAFAMNAYINAGGMLA